MGPGKLLAAGLLMPLPLSSQPTASVPPPPPIDLGDLGQGYSHAVAINTRGQIVGQSITAAGEDHAVLWDWPIKDDGGPLVLVT